MEKFVDYSDIEYVIDRWCNEVEDLSLWNSEASRIGRAILDDLKDIIPIKADEIHEYID